jgi:hypothetical protein
MATTQDDTIPSGQGAPTELDRVHSWRAWCDLVSVHPVTGWRWVKSGNGPIITKLGPKKFGVRHRHHLAWLEAREQHDAA